MVRKNKSILKILITMALILAMSVSFAGCGGTGSDDAASQTDTAASDTSDEKDDSEDSGTVAIVKQIDDVDEDATVTIHTDGASDEDSDDDSDEDSEEEEFPDGIKALQISSVILYEDGTVQIMATDDLAKNESESIYPFADSGKVKDVYVVKFGTDGFRTVLCLMEDGTISILNPKALVEDHIAVARDNFGVRDNFVSIENIGDDEEGYEVIATTDEGDEATLDFSLDE